MPVHKVKLPGGVEGYKWGTHGHVYTGSDAEQKAAEQARAIYASGYKKKKRPGKK